MSAPRTLALLLVSLSLSASGCGADDLQPRAGGQVPVASASPIRAAASTATEPNDSSTNADQRTPQPDNADAPSYRYRASERCIVAKDASGACYRPIACEETRTLRVYDVERQMMSGGGWERRATVCLNHESDLDVARTGLAGELVLAGSKS